MSPKIVTLGLIVCQFGLLESTPIWNRLPSFNEILTPTELTGANKKGLPYGISWNTCALQDADRGGISALIKERLTQQNTYSVVVKNTYPRKAE